MKVFNRTVFEKQWFLKKNLKKEFNEKIKVLHRKITIINSWSFTKKKGPIFNLFIKLLIIEKIFHTKTIKEARSILLKIYEGADLVKRIRIQGLKRQ